MVRGSLSAPRRLGYLLAVVGAAVLVAGSSRAGPPRPGQRRPAVPAAGGRHRNARRPGTRPARQRARRGVAATSSSPSRSTPSGSTRPATSSPSWSSRVVALMVSWVVDLAARTSLGRAGGRRARGRQQAPHGAARRRRPRPAHPAGDRKGGGLRAAQHRRRCSSDDDRRELLETADDALDRLAGAGRQPAGPQPAAGGAMPVRTRPVPLEDVVAAALDDLGCAAAGSVGGPARAPARRRRRPRAARAGDGQPGGQRAALRPDPPLLGAAAVGRDRVELRVVDTGPGHPARRPGPGLRALPAAGRHEPHRARSWAGALPWPGRGHGRHADLEDTPGGGLTSVVSLPAVPAPPRSRVTP